ncbi:hypothetical protein DSCW_21390 [Desulfosarcina widdelii]|uniref:Uncharacterized protein n=1 Tax=Desulfosarcina widdelii TaxID=947919 RepID=A0A5K7YYE9_9BACT|nr:hypothetical protein DSCW_21390 [Desulfosarcina widdelii]
MDKYLLARKTQIPNYYEIPLYILNQETGYVLYKPANKKIDKTQYTIDNYPNLYIHIDDKINATN